MGAEDELREDIKTVLKDVETDYLKEKVLCDACLGRIFAKVNAGFSNRTRGEIIRSILTLDDMTDPDDCWICNGLCSKVEKFADLVTRHLSEWECESFLIGSKFDPEIIEREETLWTEVVGQYSEPIKSELNREVGKLVYAKTGKEVDFDRPDIVVVVDTRYDDVKLQVKPLYIYGRYRKLVRGIPQTRWPCRACLGKGCQKCDNTGKMYQTSVEEIIGQEVMKDTGGSDHKFHGMGREDIDAQMLGRGRPFVLEIREPKKRQIAFEEMEKRINASKKGVEVSSLRQSSNQEVVALKEAKPDKKYRVVVSFDVAIEEEKLNEVVLSLGGKTITQRTPIRVVHRRADKTRIRTLRSLELCEFSPDKAALVLTAETGTYVKEFVHGDDGRTIPSLTGLLGVECTVEELDVLEILDET